MTARVQTLLEGVRRAFEGDADSAYEVFAVDAVLIEPGDRAEGLDEIVEFFLAFGGLREKFSVASVTESGDGRFEVEWVLRFRADAHGYRRDGTARVEVEEGRIVRWEADWTETEDADLTAWGGV